MCAKQEMSRWLEEWYGPYTKQMQESLRLPKDKYDASVAAFKVRSEGLWREWREREKGCLCCFCLSFTCFPSSFQIMDHSRTGVEKFVGEFFFEFN